MEMIRSRVCANCANLVQTDDPYFEGDRCGISGEEIARNRLCHCKAHEFRNRNPHLITSSVSEELSRWGLQRGILGH